MTNVSNNSPHKELFVEIFLAIEQGRSLHSLKIQLVNIQGETGKNPQEWQVLSISPINIKFN